MSAVLEFDVEIEVAEADLKAGMDAAVTVDEATVDATVKPADPEAVTAEDQQPSGESPVAPPATVDGVVAQEVSPDGPPAVAVEYTPMVDATWTRLTDDAEEEEKARLEAQWEEEMETLEHEISDLTIERIQLADRAKSIKKRIDCLAEELSDLRASGPGKPTRKPAESSVDSSTAGAGDGSLASSPAQPVSADEPSAAADDWRNAPLSELDLKKNILEKLVESSIETIGQLEDLRAAISLGKKEWPKGIGKAKITQIEDAVIDWLTKHRDSGVFQALGGSQSTGAATATTESSPSNIPTNDQWNDWTDAQRSLYLTERAVALSSDPKDDLRNRLPDASYWESGRGYFGRGAEIIDCPYTPGDWQDDWLRGFLSADMAEMAEQSEQQAEQQSDQPAEAEESSAIPPSEQADAAADAPEITLADL